MGNNLALIIFSCAATFYYDGNGDVTCFQYICIHVHNCSKHRQLPNYIRNLILYQMATLMGKSSA